MGIPDMAAGEPVGKATGRSDSAQLAKKCVHITIGLHAPSFFIVGKVVRTAAPTAKDIGESVPLPHCTF
jgi:hypothetical protein